MKFGEKITTFFMDQAFFVGLPFSLKIKTKLFFQYIRLGIKYMFLKRTNLSDRIFGKKIYALRYNFIFELFRLTFYRAQYFFKTTKKSPLILDCGANIGFATRFFKWYYPKARVHCFEPNPKVFEVLKKNTASYKDVNLHQVALSNKKEKISFYVDNDHPGELNSSTIADFNETPLEKKYTVQAITLSSFIEENIKSEEIDFVKFNIEGAEDAVIRELFEKGMLPQIKNMVFEYHHLQTKDKKSHAADLLSCLEKSGFNYTFLVLNFRLYAKNVPQNIFIYAYKK